MARKRSQKENTVHENEVDANREQEVQDKLKEAQTNLQAARERSQSPGFVPAESEESKAFEAAKQDVAEFEAAKAAEAAKEAEAAGAPAPPKFIPDPTPAEEPEPKPEQ